MRNYFIVFVACGVAFACVSPQSADAFVANPDGIAKAATPSTGIIEVKRSPHKGRPPGWSHGRKTGWHGRGKPPGQ